MLRIPNGFYCDASQRKLAACRGDLPPTRILPDGHHSFFIQAGSLIGYS